MSLPPKCRNPLPYAGTRVQPHTEAPSQNREKRESALIREESDSSDIQSKGRRESYVEEIRDSTCCLKASKVLYL
jgi:hypothetical protein